MVDLRQREILGPTRALACGGDLEVSAVLVGNAGMNDRVLRQIRDRLTAIASLLGLIAFGLAVAISILVYWHIKLERARQRVVNDPAPIKTPWSLP